MIKRVLDKKPNIRKYLFDKGFLITNKRNIDIEAFPFYNNWTKHEIENYDFYINNRTQLYTYKKGEKTFFLIGHALNPYTSEIDENAILKRVAEAHGTDKYFDTVDELTGVFILGAVEDVKMEFLLDASGMQYGCYGEIDKKQFVASHMRLIGDVTEAEESRFVKSLTNYRWYRYMMGNYLPGDLTCYENIRRIIPNTYVSFDGSCYSIKRFYPSKEIKMCKNEKEYKAVIAEGARILKKTMELIPKKWDRVAISLTGGVDSNTTFAAANGSYDKYTTFSYVSMHRESVDAEKAKEISERFSVPYKEYVIPESDEEIKNFNTFSMIFRHNDGDIGREKANEARKKITLIRSNVCDVEVKSWVSETIRAYAYKYFGKKRFPKTLTARNYTSLYKIFLLRRDLVWKSDKCFKQYFKKTALKENLYNYDESDFFVWEMMHGGKCGLNIGVMKSCFDIAIPYNNRKWLDLMLRVPLDKRISDQHHMDMKKLLNKELYDMQLDGELSDEAKGMKALRKTYFAINSHLPF